MKKFMCLISVCVLTAGVSFGGIAENYRRQWESATSNGVVRLPTNVVNRLYGSQEVLDICLSNRWDASGIAAALKGRKFSGYLAGLAYWLQGRDESAEWAKTVAGSCGKAYGFYALIMTPADKRDQSTVDFVMDIKDGSETNAPPKESAIDWYCVHKALRDRKLVHWNELTVPDLVDFLLLGGAEKHAGHVESAKGKIKNAAAPLLKRSLRDKGKSFVSKGGLNPIEQEMKPVVDALNAPKLQGLEAALRGIGVDIADIPRSPAIWDAVAAEKDAVFYGEKSAHPGADGGIILLLGPEGYNAWVKEFNEGK